jgi:hypothetical protein
MNNNDPLAEPSRLIEAQAPECMVHGKMTFVSASTEDCPIVALGISDTCVCEPGKFTCAGFVGEGCSTPSISMADYLARLNP